MVSDNPESFADLDGHMVQLAQAAAGYCTDSALDSCNPEPNPANAAPQSPGTTQDQTAQNDKPKSDSNKDDKNKDNNPPPANAGNGGKGGGKGKGERKQTAKPDNPTKGVQPKRDKDGKIIGWTLPSSTGKRTEKPLDWGKANGLDPLDPKWAKMAAIGVSTVGTVGLIHTVIATAPEWVPWLVLAF